jgi:hypothetical protein
MAARPRGKDTPAMSPAPSARPVDLLARCLSIVGHPFVAIPASLGAMTVLREADTRAVTTIALVFLALALAVLAGVRAGRFNDFDVSERERRPAFFAVLALGTLAMAVWIRDDAEGFRACLIAGAIIGGCGLLNRWMKVSLHTAFAIYAASLWATWTMGAALAALPLAGAVAWSRVHLRRHLWREVGAGALFGMVGAALLAFYP